MKLLIDSGKLLATNDFVKIIDFYKPISNLYGNLFLHDKIDKSQDLFLKDDTGTPIKLPMSQFEKESNEGNYLGLLIYPYHNGYREFRLHYFWISRDSSLKDISKNIPSNRYFIEPCLILDPEYTNNFKNHPFVSFRLGRYDNGKFVVFLHPSGDDGQNSGFIETHESNIPIRIPAEE